MGKAQGYVNLRGYYEIDASKRPEGWNAWLTLSFPFGTATLFTLVLAIAVPAHVGDKDDENRITLVPSYALQDKNPQGDRSPRESSNAQSVRFFDS